MRVNYVYGAYGDGGLPLLVTFQGKITSEFSARNITLKAKYLPPSNKPLDSKS